MASFYEAFKAKEQIASKLLKRKDVLGIGVGYYDPKDPKKGAGIIVYSQQVSASISNDNKKNKSENLKSVTAKVKGKKLSVPVRVVKNNSFKANVNINPKNFTKRIRPVQAGYSIGTPQSSGTAGLIVTNSQKKNQLYVLSNNHVLNKNNTTDYTETIQSGGADGGKTGKDRIGRLYRFAKLKKTGNNYIDAAISIPLSNSLLDPKYAVVGAVKGHYANYRVGWKFIKVGRTTGLVGGTVESINTDVKVNYGRYGGLGTIQFKNQTIIKSTQPISLPGDSGSVWLHSKDHYATALNFAGTADGKLSVSFPIHWAIQAFGTQTAVSGNLPGRTLRLKKLNSLYTRPLNAKELKTIKVL